MFTLMRGITYASVFVGFLLVFLPVRILGWSGITRAPAHGPAQIGGAVLVALGALTALWCVLAFAFVGRGTPAPFDPPRRLVVRGPYRFVRNPMYIGAVTALAGAALYYGSAALLGYTLVFLGLAHFFVVLYEEPTLQKLFGAEYDSYVRQVKRWQPRLSAGRRA